MLERAIPSTNEQLPVIGLGTWQVFDVQPQAEHPMLEQVLHEMQNAGGMLIDSSPMYGKAEEVTGNLTQATGLADKFFYATKVWIQGKKEGIKQMLKFIISHPAVTCVIPATGKPAHAKDNFMAGHGPVPDEKARKKMAALVDSF